MREWVLRAMAAALVLPLAACVEPPRASAPPGYAIGPDGRAYVAPPPRSRFGYGGGVYVPPVDTPRGYYPRSYYPPSYYPPSRHPSFWGPGWSDRRDRDDDRKKPKKRRDEPDRKPVVDAGGDPPRPDRPKPQRPKPSQKKPLIEPRSASAADESRGDRESAESW